MSDRCQLETGLASRSTEYQHLTAKALPSSESMYQKRQSIHQQRCFAARNTCTAEKDSLPAATSGTHCSTPLCSLCTCIAPPLWHQPICHVKAACQSRMGISTRLLPRPDHKRGACYVQSQIKLRVLSACLLACRSTAVPSHA